MLYTKRGYTKRGCGYRRPKGRYSTGPLFFSTWVLNTGDAVTHVTPRLWPWPWTCHLLWQELLPNISHRNIIGINSLTGSLFSAHIHVGMTYTIYSALYTFYSIADCIDHIIHADWLEKILTWQPNCAWKVQPPETGISSACCTKHFIICIWWACTLHVYVIFRVYMLHYVYRKHIYRRILS